MCFVSDGAAFATINVSEELLSEMVTNLVANAIQYIFGEHLRRWCVKSLV